MSWGLGQPGLGRLRNTVKRHDGKVLSPSLKLDREFKRHAWLALDERPRRG